MDERQTMHAMMLGDAYCVERVLADGAYGVTEMVSLDGAWPFVRKKMPLRLARRRASPFRSSCATRRGTSCSGVVSMCVNRPKAKSRAFSIQIYGLPKYASYEAYAYAS